LADVFEGSFDDLIALFIAKIYRDVFNEGLLIVLIENREAHRIIDGAALGPQKASAETVEGRDMEEEGGIGDKSAGSILHFGRDFVGEGNRQNSGRIRLPFRNEIRDAIRQNPGLARARASDDADMLRPRLHRG